MKVLRAKEGLTQKQLADKLGYTREHLAEIERGAKCGSFEFWAGVRVAFDIPEKEFLNIISERVFIAYEKKKARKGAGA